MNAHLFQPSSGPAHGNGNVLDAKKSSWLTRVWHTWLSLTAPAQARSYLSVIHPQERERLRRSGLTSLAAPLLVLITLFFFVQAAKDLVTLTALVVTNLVVLLAILLNRAGKQEGASALLVCALTAVIEGSLLGAYRLAPVWLPTLDLFALPLVLAMVLLPRRAIPLVGLVHVCCIVGDAVCMPHSSEMDLMMAQWGGISVVIVRPLMIQLLGVALCFIERRSTDHALQRADRAEEVALLQQQIASQKDQLETDMAHILQVLLQQSNAKESSSARITLPETSAVWRLSHAVNTCLNRVESARKQEIFTRIYLRDLGQVIETLSYARPHETIELPSKTGSPTDGLIDVLLKHLPHARCADPMRASAIASAAAPPHAPRRSSGASHETEKKR